MKGHLFRPLYRNVGGDRKEKRGRRRRGLRIPYKRLSFVFIDGRNVFFPRLKETEIVGNNVPLSNNKFSNFSISCEQYSPVLP